MASKRLDDYQPLKFYEQNRPKDAAKTGFYKFSADGFEYFAYQAEGRILLISQAYKARAGRDNGIVSTQKNMKLDSQYEFHKHENGKHYFDILARNKQQVATSVWFSSAKAAKDYADVLTGKRKSLPSSTTKAKAAPAKKRATNREQNYKPLAFYQDRISGKTKGFETFEEGGQHYFTYNQDGKIALISEGYPTAAIRDKGIASVKNNMMEEKQYNFGSVGGGYEGFRLRAKNHKEIARSVGYGSLAAAAAGAALIYNPRKPEPKPVPVAPIAAVTAAAATPVAAAAARPEPEPVVYHDEGGGWGWLKWLLGLLALLALAFLLLRFCQGREATVPAVPTPDPAPVAMITCWDGSEAESEAACPAARMVTCWDGSEAANMAACPPEVRMITCWDGSEAANTAACPPEVRMITCWDGSEVEDATSCPTEPVMEEPIPAPEPVRFTSGSCSCAGSNSNVFSTQGELTPRLVTRLGTNPEFGNHQGQSAAAFFSTLQNRYSSDSFDRSYLDHLARSLGYSGFADMDASMFTETRVPQGSNMILGFGRQHALQYSTLQATDTMDLEAFSVRSANGCDVNFMKTCGNFAYICE